MVNNFFFLENRAVYVIMWKNMVELDRPQMKIRRMRIACWLRKATHTFTHMLLHCKKCCTDAPPCYVVRNLPVFSCIY